jgi:hypothetical protein
MRVACASDKRYSVWCLKNTMTNYPYILFNKSPLQLRAIGARGGRAFGRNQRARRARIGLMPALPAIVPLCAAPGRLILS